MAGAQETKAEADPSILQRLIQGIRPEAFAVAPAVGLARAAINPFVAPHAEKVSRDITSGEPKRVAKGLGALALDVSPLAVDPSIKGYQALKGLADVAEPMNALGILGKPANGPQALRELIAGHLGGATLAGGIANTAIVANRQNQEAEDAQYAKQDEAYTRYWAPRMVEKFIKENPVESIDPSLPPKRVAALISERTWVKPDFIEQLVKKESGWNTDAKANSSSATGLTQFIDNTWVSEMKRLAPRTGFRGSDADALALRSDPRWSLYVGIEHSKDNANTLRQRLGSDPTYKDVYLAHFFGVDKAASFIRQNRKDSNKQADVLFPKEAQSNPSIFYSNSGQPRTVGEVYDRLTSGFSDKEF